LTTAEVSQKIPGPASTNGSVISTVLPAVVHEPSEFAVAGFLARYHKAPASAYRRDLPHFLDGAVEH
jgi:hypothetical protein